MRKGLLYLAMRGEVSERSILSLCALLIVIGWVTFEMVRPPFITVDSVTVERAIVGTDPQVAYIRTVHHKVRARWTVDIVGTDCQGTGVNDYPSGSNAYNWLLFAEYMETTCTLAPGAYAMVTCYHWLFGLRSHCAPPVALVFREKIL